MKSILKAVIIEDEIESRNLLQDLLKTNGHAKVIGSTTDPNKAVNLILSANPDIVFLDIKMPGKSGFDILDELQNLKSSYPYIVFVTAYDEFAIRAFEYAAFDYLLKPVEPKRLNDTIMRCLTNKISDRNQRTDLLLESHKKLFFRNVSGIVIIDPEDILYIEADGNYSIFNLINSKSEIVTSLLHKVEEQLPHSSFFRISRSIIINTRFLKRINAKKSQCVLMVNGAEIKCNTSRDRINELIEKMKRN